MHIYICLYKYIYNIYILLDHAVSHAIEPPSPRLSRPCDVAQPRVHLDSNLPSNPEIRLKGSPSLPPSLPRVNPKGKVRMNPG